MADLHRAVHRADHPHADPVRPVTDADFDSLVLSASKPVQTALDLLPRLASDPTKPFERYAGVNDGVAAAPFTFDQLGAERRIAQLADSAG